MPAFIGFLLGGFADGLIKFFNLFSKNWTISKVLVYFVFYWWLFLSFLALVYKLISNVMSFTNSAINEVNSAIVNPNGELLNVAFAVLKTIGFFEALASTFNNFVPFLGMVLELYIAKISVQKAWQSYLASYHIATLYTTNSASKNGNRFFNKK